MSVKSKLFRIVKKPAFSSAISVQALPIGHEKEWLREDTVKPYSEIPGPKQLPFLGNSWRFAPYIGIMIEYKKNIVDV